MRVECYCCKSQYEVEEATDLKELECPKCHYRNAWRKVELGTCSECQNVVAQDAPLCPHCGHQFRPVHTSPDVKRISSFWVLAVAAAFALIHLLLVWLVLDLTLGRFARAMMPGPSVRNTAPAVRSTEDIMQAAANGLRLGGRFTEVRTHALPYAQRKNLLPYFGR